MIEEKESEKASKNKLIGKDDRKYALKMKHSCFQQKELVFEKLLSENLEEKRNFITKLSQKVVTTPNVAHFFISKEFLRFILSQISTSELPIEFLDLLSACMYKRDKPYGLQLSVEILSVTMQCFERVADFDLTSTLSIISYILIENINIIKLVPDLIEMIITLANTKLEEETKPQELASLSSVLLPICKISSEISEEERSALPPLLFKLLNFSVMNENGIKAVLISASQYIYDEESCNEMKETGFFSQIITHFFDYSESLWCDELEYLSQCLEYTEEGQETGLEDFDEMIVLQKLLNCTHLDEDYIITCCCFLAYMVPLREERIGEWMSLGLLEWSLENFSSFAKLEKSLLVDLFISILNAAIIDIVEPILDTEMPDFILEIFVTYADDKTKLSIIKMFLRVFELMKEAGHVNEEVAGKVSDVLEESVNSEDDEIAELSAVLLDEIGEDL